MNTLASVSLYIKSKAVSLGVFVLAVIAYSMLPAGTPFVELAYTAVTVFGVIIIAPIIRLLVFNEAALYGEGGQLVKDIMDGKFTPGMVHYWFATFISYAAPIVCISTIAK